MPASLMRAVMRRPAVYLLSLAVSACVNAPAKSSVVYQQCQLSTADWDHRAPDASVYEQFHYVDTGGYLQGSPDEWEWFTSRVDSNSVMACDPKARRRSNCAWEHMHLVRVDGLWKLDQVACKER